MKLDKIKFASLIGFISCRYALTVTQDDMRKIDELIDIELPMSIEHNYPKNEDVERLMKLMVEGMHKIEAIKMYRNITGMGLRESKNTVERYWVSKPEPIKLEPNATLDF